MDQTHIGYTNWQQPDKNIEPAVQRIAVSDIKKLGVAVEGDESAWPGADTQATLPELSPYGVQSRYIDVFSRGAEAIKFSLKTDKPWLKLSEYRGATQSSSRILVSVDWKAAPEGEQWIPIIIQSGNESVKVLAHVNKQLIEKPFKGFVEANGYVAMEAAHFTHAINSQDIEWREIANLGRTDSGVTMFPVTAPSQSLTASSPHLEYAVQLVNAGAVNVQVFLAPTLNFTGGQGLRYAVSIDDRQPQIVNMQAGSNGQADDTDPLWNRWVANDINIQSSKFEHVDAGKHVVKLWMIDPGVVFERVLLISKDIPSSYFGPPESMQLH